MTIPSQDIHQMLLNKYMVMLQSFSAKLYIQIWPSSYWNFCGNFFSICDFLRRKNGKNMFLQSEIHFPSKFPHFFVKQRKKNTRSSTSQNLYKKRKNNLQVAWNISGMIRSNLLLLVIFFFQKCKKWCFWGCLIAKFCKIFIRFYIKF